MSALPTIGTISYGLTPGSVYAFPVETETIGAKVEPILSGDGRTLIGNKYEVSLHWYVASGSGIDATIADIRNRLTRPCGIFTYTGLGLGSLSINGFAGQQDINFGPIPKTFSWKPLGAGLAAECWWTVGFTIADCKGTAAPWYNAMELVWTVGYAQDNYRLTRRTFKGYLRVPNNRTATSSRQVIDSADRYWEKVCPPVLYGFRRESEERTPSEDRSRLDFSVVDAQMETAPPPGVVEFTFDHTQQNSSPLKPVWSVSFHGRYKMALHFSPALGYGYFINSVLDRLQGIRTADNNAAIIPVHLSFREDAKTRTGDFSAVFMSVIPILQATQAGMWRPLPGHDFRLWQQSMAFANVPRGYTQEVFKPSDDIIIDLCGSGSADLAPPSRLLNPAAGPAGGFPCPPCPDDPNNSYLHWECTVHISFDQGTADHWPLPSKALPKPASSLTDFLPLSTAGSAAARDQNAQPIQQQRTAPRVFVTLAGWGLRVCYPVPVPKLVSIAGNPALPANREGIEFQSSQYMPGVCQPFMISRWQQRYVITAPPSSSPSPSPLPVPPPGGGGQRPNFGGFAPPGSGPGFIIIAPGQGTQGGGQVPLPD